METIRVAVKEVDPELLQQIDAVQLSERLRAERVEFFKRDVEVVGERSVLAMESWQKTKGDVLDVRWARLVKEFAERLPVVIFRDQLVVGSETKVFRGAEPWVEGEALIVSEVMEKGKNEISLGAARVSRCTPEDFEAVEEATEFFLGNSPLDVMFNNYRMLYGDWVDNLEKAHGNMVPGRNHLVTPVPVWEAVLDKGLRSIIQEAEAGFERVRKGAEPDAKKAWFWQAVVISCEAVIHHAHRYSRLARDLAHDEPDQSRRKELETIAEACEQVPEYPARTLLEAAQSRIMVGLAVKRCMPALMLDESGRVDQYLYPYFMSDIRKHRISMQEAGDIVGSMLSNVSRRDGVKSVQRGQNAQGTLVNNVVLGGLSKDGKNADNELTYLILHMAGLLKYAEPHYTLRVNTGTPKWILLKAIDTNRKVGGGQPQFMSDERVISYLVKQGEDIEDARDWMGQGCSQTVAGGQGTRSQLRTVCHFNMPLLLDMALHNGVASLTRKLIGIETGDPRAFRCYQDLWQAYAKQAEFVVPRLHIIACVAHRVDQERVRYPLVSCLAPGCMDKGQDFLVGGLSNYLLWDWKDRGHVDVADSLMSVKKLVFDEKKLTMAELLEALDSNFEGEKGERVRQMCLAAPKYGNGIDEVDRMVGDSGRLMPALIQKYVNPMGGPYSINRHGVAWHYFAGKGVGALPNGRKAREPLNDGSLSPMRGTDRKGITTVLRSAITAEESREARVSVLNQKIPVGLMQTTEAMEKLSNLTQTFLTSGGSHIQYNILDRNILLDARKHPEHYKDLVVRVAGYSAYWVHLTPEIQDDIIARTEQTV